jgi:hypothetical protein
MPTQQPRYSAEETAQRGDEIYERDIRAQLEETHHGKVVAIDIDRGAYIVDENALATPFVKALSGLDQTNSSKIHRL